MGFRLVERARWIALAYRVLELRQLEEWGALRGKVGEDEGLGRIGQALGLAELDGNGEAYQGQAPGRQPGVLCQRG